MKARVYKRHGFDGYYVELLIGNLLFKSDALNTEGAANSRVSAIRKALREGMECGGAVRKKKKVSKR